jgi:hypothetical protein
MVYTNWAVKTLRPSDHGPRAERRISLRRQHPGKQPADMSALRVVARGDFRASRP